MVWCSAGNESRMGQISVRIGGEKSENSFKDFCHKKQRNQSVCWYGGGWREEWDEERFAFVVDVFCF